MLSVYGTPVILPAGRYGFRMVANPWRTEKRGFVDSWLVTDYHIGTLEVTVGQSEKGWHTLADHFPDILVIEREGDDSRGE